MGDFSTGHMPGQRRSAEAFQQLYDHEAFVQAHFLNHFGQGGNEDLSRFTRDDVDVIAARLQNLPHAAKAFAFFGLNSNPQDLEVVILPFLRLRDSGLRDRHLLAHEATGGVYGVDALELENHLAIGSGSGAGNQVRPAINMQRPTIVEPVGNVAQYMDSNTTGDTVGGGDASNYDVVGEDSLVFRHLALPPVGFGGTGGDAGELNDLQDGVGAVLDSSDP